MEHPPFIVDFASYKPPWLGHNFPIIIPGVGGRCWFSSRRRDAGPCLKLKGFGGQLLAARVLVTESWCVTNSGSGMVGEPLNPVQSAASTVRQRIIPVSEEVPGNSETRARSCVFFCSVFPVCLARKFKGCKPTKDGNLHRHAVDSGPQKPQKRQVNKVPFAWEIWVCVKTCQNYHPLWDSDCANHQFCGSIGTPVLTHTTMWVHTYIQQLWGLYQNDSQNGGHFAFYNFLWPLKSAGWVRGGAPYFSVSALPGANAKTPKVEAVDSQGRSEK